MPGSAGDTLPDEVRHADKLVYLESARGIAALMVVFFHLTMGFLPRESLKVHHTAYASRAASVLNFVGEYADGMVFNGSFAVRFFFVLSGFVLSLSYWRTRKSSVLRSATLRRYPRLAVPVLGTTIIAWCLLGGSQAIGEQVARITNQRPDCWLTQITSGRSTFSHALYEGTYGTFFNFSPVNLDCCLWTMPIELVNSFVIFALLPLAMPLRHRFAVYAGLLLGLALFREPYTVDFLAGLIVADLFVNFGRSLEFRSCRLVAAALLIWAFPVAILCSFVADRYPSLEVVFVQLPTLPAASVLLALLISPDLQRLLEKPVLAFLGKISFGIYLIHVPLMGSVGVRLYLLSRLNWHLPHGTAVAIVGFAVTALTVVLASLMHQFLEMPGIVLGRSVDRFFNRPPSESYAFAIATA